MLQWNIGKVQFFCKVGRTNCQFRHFAICGTPWPIEKVVLFLLLPVHNISIQWNTIDFKSQVCFWFFPKDLKSGYHVTGKIIDMPFFPDPFECPKIGVKVQYGKIKILFWHFPKLLKTYRGQRMHNFLHIAITLWHFRKVKHILFWSLNIFSQCIFVS